MYKLEVPHSMLHAMREALAVAMFLQEVAPSVAQHFTAVTSGPQRQIELLKLERAIMAAHRVAVKVDGHGDEFLTSPIEGEELADAMSNHDERLRELDAKIEKAQKELQ